jgi:alcohol dehydrogenase (cytochrome c)
MNAKIAKNAEPVFLRAQTKKIFAAFAAFGFALSLSPASHAQSPGVRFEDIARPKPGAWPTYDGSLSGNRFSPLDQINTSNVQKLAPKWMFTIQDTPRALEGTPVVVDGVMYVTSVNEAIALDARTGREIWHFSRPRTQGLAGDAASGINRGVAVLGDRVFMVTDNAHVIALDRAAGKLLWDVEMADSRQNYGATGAPLVVNDLVIAGVSGGDEGIRGFVDAYRASTGERAWRFWTVPARGEPGSETWIGRAIEHGCAATWLTGTYDPEARLLYWPTGNPCPDYNGDERKGDNLYSASVVALDPDTGKLRWHYQFTPHDLHDWDANETPVLVDVQFRGQPRKLLLQGNRNGFFYVLDRLTGKVLVGRTVREEPDVGQRHRSRRPAEVVARQRAERGGPARLSRRRRRRRTGRRPPSTRRHSCSICSPTSRVRSTRKTTNGGRRASRSTAAPRAVPPAIRLRPSR